MSKLYRLAIVGGGAAGLAAACEAGRRAGSGVILLEGGKVLGKKLLSTGNGRCNLTHESLDPGVYHGSCAYLAEQLLTPEALEESRSFFRRIGVELCSIDGYVYPRSREAESVRGALEDAVRRQGVEIRTEFRLHKLEKTAQGFALCAENGETVRSQAVILAAGGCAFPRSGSDGSGLTICEELGLSVRKPLPALVGLRVEESFLRKMAGARILGRVWLTFTGRKPLPDSAVEEGEIQWKEDGLSGIPVMQLSGEALRALDRGENVRIHADFLSEYTREKLEEIFRERVHAAPQAESGSLLRSLVPERCVSSFLSLARIPLHVPLSSLSVEQTRQLAALVKDLTLTVTGSYGFESAQTTTGGVSDRALAEDRAHALESRDLPGLFFAGEILDIDGPCGGYNLEWAWTSGREAARETL